MSDKTKVPRTLLLADDSATIQRVIELTFAGEDIHVVTVSDGDQAIARLEAAPPDIVLADVGMPGKNGYEVAEYVKHSPHLAHIPVVLLTGAFEPVDQVKAASAGCDGVLAKPFEPQIVIGRVRELLGRAALQAVAAPAAAPAAFGESPFPAEPAPAQRVDDYFDRLDAAFASLSNAPLHTRVDETAPEPDLAIDIPTRDLAIADEFALELPAEPMSILDAAPLAPVDAQEPESLELPEPPGPRVRVLPSIADAFAAIVAAEQNALGARPEWPTPSQPAEAPPTPAPVEIVITDELVDRVARRVLEQLSDRVVRETVATKVSDVAERLVREEIERIKASIK